MPVNQSVCVFVYLAPQRDLFTRWRGRAVLAGGIGAISVDWARLYLIPLGLYIIPQVGSGNSGGGDGKPKWKRARGKKVSRPMRTELTKPSPGLPGFSVATIAKVLLPKDVTLSAKKKTKWTARKERSMKWMMGMP